MFNAFVNDTTLERLEGSEHAELTTTDESIRTKIHRLTGHM